MRLHFLGRFGHNDRCAQFADHADEKAFRVLVATLHVDHPVGMSGIADNNAFLARTEDSGGSLLTLHFSQEERIEILRLAAALKTTPEQLIRQIIRRHLLHDVAWNRGH
ncbi:MULTISPECIES: hypothetical protein [Leifsonia]|uniref:Ribbon-helix-helix protein CopG domain-containing protein n=1 Tax=Leifsonia virtsii TaxID=3035915 RepID=A0ABT8J081_9MICO|nr:MULTISPECIES: hypothetical protein [Leifsonia]MDN4597689.1 hypothetical protein [Leifsonia virtsii]NUU08223.1 hypothetical protein [Leifsonia sp. C5G2]